MEKFPRDMFGQYVHPGHILLYPVRRGSNMKMKYGVVNNIVVKTLSTWNDNVDYKFECDIYSLSSKFGTRSKYYLAKRKFISFKRSFILPLSYFSIDEEGHSLIRNKVLEILKNGKY